jgi:hypothetical protein
LMINKSERRGRKRPKLFLKLFGPPLCVSRNYLAHRWRMRVNIEWIFGPGERVIEPAETMTRLKHFAEGLENVLVIEFCVDFNSFMQNQFKQPNYPNKTSISNQQFLNWITSNQIIDRTIQII